MKNKKTVLVGMLLTVLLLAILLPLSLPAAAATELKPEWVTESQGKYTFRYFDFSDRGNIALVFEAGGELLVEVYSPQGEFLYGIRLPTGQGTVVFFAGEDIGIYCVRSECTFYIRPDGSWHCVEGYFDYEAQGIWDGILNSETTKPNSGPLNGKTYHVQHDRFFSYGTKFFLTDGDGEETVIYDVTAGELMRTSHKLLLILICGFLLKKVLERDEQQKRQKA